MIRHTLSGTGAQIIKRVT